VVKPAAARQDRGRRILILVENLPVPFDRRVWMEATALREAGYGVSVICPKGSYRKAYEELDGVRIYRYPLRSRGGLFGHMWEYAVALPATFALSCVVAVRDRFDAIQSANPPDFFFPIGRFFKLFGKRFVFDHHDLVPEMCDARWSGIKLRLVRALCVVAERATFRTADRVISTNESYRQVALGRGGMSFDRVTVVRSGPRLDAFRRVEPLQRHKNGRAFLVAYVGVMGPNDGVDYLLRAAKHVVHTRGRSDVQFVLIGHGDVFPELTAMSRRLGLGDYVRFTGRLPDADLLSILSTADVGAAPDPKDAWNDVSTMNKIVEYMAVGLPVVAFDLKEARVSAGEAAVYARPNESEDFGDKILELLDSAERRRCMSVTGRERFEKELAWEHQRERLVGLYRGLLGA
jgi:glycosyltransferase involved in cell wall biosynthesis